MRCKKAKNMLPLFIGSDLSSRKMSLIRSHLEKCSRCRTEYESYVKSKEVLTGWMEENRTVWDEPEWRNSVNRAVSASLRDQKAFAPWPFRNAWAYALMAATAFILTLFLVLPVFRNSQADMESDYAVSGSSAYSLGSFGQRKQDVITMTLVSRETGTKIVWFLDRNFQLEE